MLTDFDRVIAGLQGSSVGRAMIREPHLLRAEACRRSLFHFTREFWGEVIDEEPVYNWHIPFVCRELEAILWRVIARLPKLYDLIINIPPGTTKTTVAMVMFPAWSWVARLPRGFDPAAERTAAQKAARRGGDDPRPGGANLRFITGSYALDIALKASQLSRDIIRSEKFRLYFPEIALREDQDSKSDYANTHFGSRFSTSVGAKVMGTHAHLIGVDDPVDPEQALSDLDRARANEFMDNVRTRAVDKKITPIYLIMQRLHEDDPSAHLKTRAKSVRHIRLPGDDSWEVSPPELRREYERSGGLLDPVRMPRSVLDDLRLILGPYKYAGQVGQDPRPREGGMFQRHWFEVVDAAPDGGVEVRGWDLAASKKKQGGAGAKQAATAGVKLKIVGARVVKGGLAGGTVYVLDEVHLFGTGGEVRAAMRATASQDGPDCIQDVPQDPGQAGKDQVRSIVADLHGFRVRHSPESGDKAVRAEPFSSQCEAGNVKLVRGAWNDAWLEEVTLFPNGRKDRVDATVRAYTRAVAEASRASATVGGPAGVTNTRQMSPDREVA